MSKRVVLVTSNPQKAKEIGQALRPHGVLLSHRNVDIPEIQTDTLEEVITDKVEKAFAIVKKPVIVDDAGMFFVGYKHFPGVYSRFVFSGIGFDGLFRLIKQGQSAYFASFIAYKENARSKPVLFSGRCHGTLTTRIRGKKKPKMPYDNFFIPKGETRTFAQMTVAEKQQHDHRSKAVRKLAKYFDQQT